MSCMCCVIGVLYALCVVLYVYVMKVDAVLLVDCVCMLCVCYVCTVGVCCKCCGCMCIVEMDACTHVSLLVAGRRRSKFHKPGLGSCRWMIQRSKTWYVPDQVVLEHPGSRQRRAELQRTGHTCPCEGHYGQAPNMPGN